MGASLIRIKGKAHKKNHFLVDHKFECKSWLKKNLRMTSHNFLILSKVGLSSLSSILKSESKILWLVVLKTRSNISILVFLEENADLWYSFII